MDQGSFRAANTNLAKTCSSIELKNQRISFECVTRLTKAVLYGRKEPAIPAIDDLSQVRPLSLMQRLLS
jgi:hypothetical protein